MGKLMYKGPNYLLHRLMRADRLSYHIIDNTRESPTQKWMYAVCTDDGPVSLQDYCKGMDPITINSREYYLLFVDDPNCSIVVTPVDFSGIYSCYCPPARPVEVIGDSPMQGRYVCTTEVDPYKNATMEVHNISHRNGYTVLQGDLVARDPSVIANSPFTVKIYHDPEKRNKIIIDSNGWMGCDVNIPYMYWDDAE